MVNEKKRLSEVIELKTNRCRIKQNMDELQMLQKKITLTLTIIIKDKNLIDIKIKNVLFLKKKTYKFTVSHNDNNMWYKIKI